MNWQITNRNNENRKTHTLIARKVSRSLPQSRFQKTRQRTPVATIRRMAIERCFFLDPESEDNAGLLKKLVFMDDNG
jgi:hypothetical protein